MVEKIDSTQKLIKIVKHRKTPVVVNKQENNYKRSKNSGKGLAYESYSYNYNE